MKSSDQVFQNRTHYFKKGGHFLTFTNVVLTNARVVLFHCGAASSSPTMGDGVLTAKLLQVSIYYFEVHMSIQGNIETLTG